MFEKEAEEYRKEELEKEANKYAKGITEKYVFMEHGRASALGYLAGAEPREKRLAELEKENAELKAIINAPLIKGRRTTRKEFYQTIWDLSGQLTNAKELLAKWVELFKPKLEGYPITPIQEQTEQFLKE